MYKSDEIKEVTVEATSYCNARCPQCDRFDIKNNTIVPLKHLSLETIKKINKQSLPSLQKVLFEGGCGDILNHPQALEIAKCFSEVGELIFVTNGGIRNTKYFENLAEVKNLKIIFSIDGLEDTNHLYRQNTNFDKIIDNARAFINAGGHAIWKFIVFKHNQHQLDKAKQLSDSLGFKEFILVRANEIWHEDKKWPVYNKGKYQHTIEPATINIPGQENFEGDYFDSNNNIINLNNRLINYYKNIKLPMICPKHRTQEIFVDVNGNMLPCCMLATDFWNNSYNTKFLKSLIKTDNISINNHTIEEILQTDFYTKRLPESLAKTPMPKCLKHCYKSQKKFVN